MIIVTSGARYIDIDAYACSIAYAELLQLLGKQAAAVSTAPWNESVTKSLRSLNAPLQTLYSPNENDQYIVVDVSDPAHFDKIVDRARIIEVWDHHTGLESYWAERIAEDSHIGFVGAEATPIYEQWAKAGKLTEMSNTSAQLLAAAILDNTLNFKAGVTTERDKTAYQFLSKHASLDDNWVTKYFSECQATITAGLVEALINDTKFIKFNKLPQELCVGQIVVWDAKPLIETEQSVIASTLGSMSSHWMANIVSISEGRSYFLSDNPIVREWSQEILNIQFQANLATADRLWLRKEILKLGLAQ